MRSGNLQHPITIERLTEELDEYRTPRQVWTPIATVKAEVLTASTKEFLQSFGVGNDAAIVFRIRYLEGVTPADRIIFDGGFWNVKEIREIGRRRGLELRANGRASA